MQRYKAFLKYLLAANMICILVIAGLGFRQEYQKKKIAQVSGIPKSKMVIPVGKTVGIYINTKGILVIDTSEVTDMEGKNYAPAKNKLMSGDYIQKLNGQVVRTKKQLINAITNSEGKDLVFEVIRNDKTIEVLIKPVQTDVNIYKVGIWVRDDLQGLGTVTYVDGTEFGALGHSINDMDTGELLKVERGEIYDADIFGIERGTEGEPGEIEGMIAYQTENIVGEINENQLYGIYGTITENFKNELQSEEPVKLASSNDVKKGTAYIQSYISGERKLYEIEIKDIHKNENDDLQMEIAVKDENLISLTGGIVQGMSGSPVLQNGRIVGAVTHVFVDDPTRGYAIFIEEMLEDN